jgi:arylsulfatase A-like enzyme
VVTEGIVDGPAYLQHTRKRQSEFTDPRTTIGIRTARYKLIHDASGTVELYDLDVDPNELVSVADDPEYREIRNELTRLWLKYKDCAGAECNAPLPPSLATSPAQTTKSTKAQWKGVLARHGHAF